MKKFLCELLASILIVVMTVGSLPNLSYADELLVSTDAYYSETEEGLDRRECTIEIENGFELSICMPKGEK